MAGETEKSQGIVLAIHPWSRTSHIVRWLVRDRGVIVTSVKGAVRPKSAFLGQYDFFYTCELIWYCRAQGDLHALREVTPLCLREGLRGRWRETTLAGYATMLAGRFAAPRDAARWFDFLSRFLDDLAAPNRVHPAFRLLQLECTALEMIGLQPDFSEADTTADSIPFAIDAGHPGESIRTFRLKPEALALLCHPADAIRMNTTMTSPSPMMTTGLRNALDFLGVFLAYHAEISPEERRSVLSAVLTPPPASHGDR